MTPLLLIAPDASPELIAWLGSIARGCALLIFFVGLCALAGVTSTIRDAWRPDDNRNSDSPTRGQR